MKMKSTAIFLVLTIFLMSSLYLQTGIMEVNAELSNDDDFQFQVDQYNATSSSDYFNESKHPRYPLVTQPFGMIQYPHKAFPTIIEFAEEFNIAIQATKSATDWLFTLIDGTTSVNVEIIDSEYIDDQRIFTVSPSQNTEGLYDLQLNCSEGDDYQTHAVKIIEEKKYPYTFVQISDIHFPTYFGTGINTTEINLEEIEKIRLLNPDFVICTGDLVQGPQLMFFNPETGKAMSMKSQVRLGLWALDLLDIPVYYIAGNHEFSESSLVPDDLTEAWHKYLGPLRYQNFDYLDWSFVGFGSDSPGLYADEKDSLKGILNEVAGKANVLYYHFDFAGDATELINKYPIEVGIYGHRHEDTGELRSPVLENYYKEGTLYHLQGPLYGRYFELFTINNETSLTLNNTLYNFILEPYTPEKTSSSVYLVLLSAIFVVSFNIRRKRRNNI
ncbi:MAG: metallophosphoesterase [Candidatus Heimdallarchaeota archaeon]|nr:metallophosphoesterase [Candidatus Heimdallarchaeota archaeon]MCK4769102.1 metallophosphoesterase [Candidatus Heimdallarchaeota archaeon]